MCGTRTLSWTRFFCYLLVFTLFAACFAQSRAWAEWDYYKRVRVRNEQGDRLRFGGWNGQYVRIWLILGSNEKGAFEHKLPVYRIDDHPVRRLKRDATYPHLRVREGRWIRWRLSEGQNPSARLQEFMHGDRVVFQYTREDGKIIETAFSLQGAASALGSLLE